MKRKYFIAGGITVTIFLVTILLWITWPSTIFASSLFSEKYGVDTSKDIIFDFKQADVSIRQWGKDYVEVTYDNVFGGKKVIDISNIDNTLILNSNLDFSGAKHITINVPKAVISIYGKSIEAKSVTFRSIKADKASLRYCSMADGFTSEGNTLIIREGSFDEKATLKNEIIELRECIGNDITIFSDGSSNKINATLRELEGKSVKINGEGCKSIATQFKDCKLDELIIDYPKGNGRIDVYSGDIKRIENNSNININKKSNILR